MKKILLLTLLFSLALTSSGCMSSSELDTLAIASSVVYDETDDGEVSVTLEIMNPSVMGGGPEQSGGQGSNSVHVTGEGRTISDAFNQITQSFERRLYYPHITSRFYTEKFTKDKLEESLDLLLRDYGIRENASMIILRDGSADKLYKASIGLAENVADYIEGMEITQPYMNASSVFVDSVSFMRAYYLDGEEPVLGVAELIKEEKPIDESTKSSAGSGGSSGQSEGEQYRIKYAGLAVFRDANLLGFLDGQETRAFKFVTNDIKTAVFSLPFDGLYTDVVVTSSHADIRADIGGDKPAIGIKIKSALNIRAEQGTKNMDDEQTLRQISDKFNGILKEEIEKTIRRVQQEYQSDIFGFGKIAHIQNPQKWKEIKEDWNTLFSNAEVHVEVESTVKRIGKIRQSFRLEA